LCPSGDSQISGLDGFGGRKVSAFGSKGYLCGQLGYAGAGVSHGVVVVDRLLLNRPSNTARLLGVDTRVLCRLLGGSAHSSQGCDVVFTATDFHSDSGDSGVGSSANLRRSVGGFHGRNTGIRSRGHLRGALGGSGGTVCSAGGIGEGVESAWCRYVVGANLLVECGHPPFGVVCGVSRTLDGLARSLGRVGTLVLAAAKCVMDSARSGLKVREAFAGM
jgi:hypothetical protein